MSVLVRMTAQTTAPKIAAVNQLMIVPRRKQMLSFRVYVPPLATTNQTARTYSAAVTPAL